MITTKKFIGVDVNLETSLFECGLLVKQNPDIDGDYACVYAIQDKFDIGYISEESVNIFLNLSWFNKESFLLYCGLKEDEWISLSFVNKLSDLLNYYGYENIFGSSYGDLYTDEEVIKWLNDY